MHLTADVTDRFQHLCQKMKFRLKGGWGLHWYGDPERQGIHDHGHILPDEPRSSHEDSGLPGLPRNSCASNAGPEEGWAPIRLVHEQELVGKGRSCGRGRKREAGMPKAATLHKTASFRSTSDGAASTFSESRQVLLAAEGSEEQFADAEAPIYSESRVLQHIDHSMARLEARLDAKIALHMDNLRALLQGSSSQESENSKPAPTEPRRQGRLQTLPMTAPYHNIGSLKKVPYSTRTNICAFCFDTCTHKFIWPMLVRSFRAGSAHGTCCVVARSAYLA